MIQKARILVIDDEQGIRDLLSFELGLQGHVVESASNGEEGLEKIQHSRHDLVIIDLKMPKLGGIETLTKIKEIDPEAEVIVATGFGTVETAIEAMKVGAYDYIAKPFHIEELGALIQKALESRDLKLEVTLYKTMKVLHSSLDIDELLQTAMNLVLKTVTSDSSSILLFGTDESLRPVFSQNLSDDRAELCLEIAQGAVDRLGTTMEPFIENGQPASGIGSTLIAPLIAKNKILGLICLMRPERSPGYNERDLRNMVLFSGQIAQAIENANLYAELEIKIEKLKKAEEFLEYGATHDPLTKLPNRTLLYDRVYQSLGQAQRHQYVIAILLMDLDNFKEVNDTLGHDIGDGLLKEVASRLPYCLREYDTIARLGGDEFVLVVTDLKNEFDVERMLRRILDSFKTPFVINHHEIRMTPSLGVALFPNDGDSIEMLLKNADVAMYEAKKRGGNGYCFFTTNLGTAVEEQKILKEGLQRALDQGEFVLEYQPLNDTITGKVLGAEALIRWKHPEKGIVPPLTFIPVAEKTGLIRPIGEWVLETACRQGARWQQEGFGAMPIAVNLSSLQFQEEGLVNKIVGIIEKSGFSPESLILEITESSAMQNIESSIRVMQELRHFGVRFLIDDFGSSYSSLNWLKELPVQGLKIDRFFVQNIVDDPFSAAIVKTIITMAHSLNIKVVAEGVETAKQLNFLKTAKWGHDEVLLCDEVQGYFFSKPLTSDDFTTLLKAQSL